GEEVVAFAALRSGANAEPDELVGHCRERLAAYKYPRRVVIVDELPKSATGKILKSRLTGGARSRPASAAARRSRASGPSSTAPHWPSAPRAAHPRARRRTRRPCTSCARTSTPCATRSPPSRSSSASLSDRVSTASRGRRQADAAEMPPQPAQGIGHLHDRG